MRTLPRWTALAALGLLCLVGCEQDLMPGAPPPAKDAPLPEPSPVDLLATENRSGALVFHTADDETLEWEMLPGGVLRQETSDYLTVVNTLYGVIYEARKDPLTGQVRASVESVEHDVSPGLKLSVTFVDHQTQVVEERVFEALPGTVRSQFVGELNAWYEPRSVQYDVGLYSTGFWSQQTTLGQAEVDRFLRHLLLEGLRTLPDPGLVELIQRYEDGGIEDLDEVDPQHLEDLRAVLCGVFGVGSLLCVAGGFANPVCTVATVGGALCLLHELLTEFPDAYQRLREWLNELGESLVAIVEGWTRDEG